MLRSGPIKGTHRIKESLMATEIDPNNPGVPGSGGTAAKASRDEVMRDFQSLVDCTEKLRQSASEMASEEFAELREQFHDYLKRARDSLNFTESSLREQGASARQWTERCVQDHPWCTIGVASGVGFLLGLLARR